MIHLVFNRPKQSISVYDSTHAAVNVIRGEGDAWGHGVGDEYGYEGWMPPGHFLLLEPQTFSTPVASEGFGQIPVSDVYPAALQALVKAGDATFGEDGMIADIGGTLSPVGQLAKHNRSALMIHGGGSNAPEPLADKQELCKTYGCTRVYNADWKWLASWLGVRFETNVVVFTVIGDPVVLAC